MSKYYFEKRYLSSWQDHEEAYRNNLERIIDRNIEHQLKKEEHERNQLRRVNQSDKSTEGNRRKESSDIPNRNNH